MCTSEAKGFRRLFMKKKLLYVIMSLVFALALCGGSVAVLTTSDALARLNGGENVAAGETTTEGENIVVEGSSEGEDITVSASVTAANIQASQSGWTKVPASTVNGVGSSYGYYKNYSYSGSTNTSGNVQYEDLPAGTYLFEAWGAQGGNDGSIGGHGGYIRGIYTLSAATRVYIVVGGYGSSSQGNAPGGYNGGAKAGSYGSSGGGGGATHFATASGVLSSLKNNKGAVILVAGGGGGAGNNGHYGYGGETPQGNSIGASGGRATGAIVNNDSYFGQGQACVTTGDRNDGGGGGGGYWGGWGSTTDSNGGGGSSYCNTGTAGNVVKYKAGKASINGNATMPNPTSYNANKTHNASSSSTPGYARITCLNNPPVNKNATITATVRGTSATVAPSTIADDAGAYHTERRWAENNRVYTNSACTALVDSNVLAVSGMSANSTGSMTLMPKRYFGATTYYAKVRDDMGFVTTVSFRYSVTDSPITALSGINAHTTGSNGTYKYFVGPSTTNVQGDWINNTDTVSDVIYNPAGKDRYTVFIPKPITQTERGIYINAADLYTDDDVGRGYDDIVITSIGNASSSSYSIVTNSADYKYGRGYGRVCVTHNGAAQSAGYISSVTLTVQSVEKSTNRLMGSPVTITVVFKVSNTRPTLKQNSGATYPDPYYAINVGDTQRINVTDICVDIDNNKNEIKEIVVPQNQFVYLDTYGNYIHSSLSPNSNYFFTEAQNPKAPDSMTTARGTNVLKFEPESIVDASSDTSRSYLSYTIDPEGQYITINGLRATRNQYTDNSFTRTGDFYFLVRVEDKGDPTDRGIWFPVAVRVNNTTPSQISPAAIADSTSSEATTDANGNKVMYFSPMGIGTLTADASIRDDDNHIRGLAEDVDTFAVQAKNSTAGEVKTYMYNEFLVLDMDQFGAPTAEYPNGVIETEFYRIEPHKLYASSVTAAKIAKGQTIVSSGDSDDMSWQRYDEWGTDIKTYSADIIEFWGIKVTFLRSTSGVYIQQPIVIKDTRNAANSKTKPVGGNLDGLVNLLVKVDNSTVKIHDSATLAQQKITARRDFRDSDSGIWTHRDSEVTVSANSNSSSVIYTVPNGYTFEITPYDLAYDLDMASGWEVGKNTNTNRVFSMWEHPENSTDNSAEYRLDSAYESQFNDAHADISDLFYTSNPLELSTTPATLKLDRLAFDGSAQMISSTGGTATVTTEEANRRSYVTVSTSTRTSAGNPLAFRVKISDGASIAEVTVQVNVSDNLPEIRTDAKNVFYLSSNINGVNDTTTNSSDDYQGNNFQGSTANRDLFNYGYNIREFRPTDIAQDFEPDTLYFADATFTFYSLVKTGGGKTVEFDGKTYYEFTDGSSYVTAEFAQATGGRSGQVFKVTARSSTQNLPGGLFVGVNITDNYGYDASANRAEIIIQLEVRNSAPELNRDVDRGFAVVDKITGGDNPELDDPSSDTVSYEWRVSPNNESEVVNADYYVASSLNVYNALVASGVSSKNIRILTADNDALQNLYLYAGAGNENTDNDYPNLPVYGLDTPINRDPSTANDVAMMFTLPDGQSDIRIASLIFCDADGSVMTTQPYKEIVAGSNTTIANRLDGYTGKQDITEKYVDNPNWAIKITTQRSFASPMRFTVRVRDSLDNARGETRYDGKRTINDDGTPAVGTANIDGYKEFTFYFNMGSLGMTAPHEVYTPDYEYVDGTGTIQRPGFKYNGIALGSSGALVPLSYFAYTASLPGQDESGNDLTATSAVSFNGAYYTRSTQTDMLSRLTLTDGTNIWTGSGINNNPYIKFEIQTDTKLMGTEPSLGFTTDYYNTGLLSSSLKQVYTRIYENRQGIKMNVRGPRPSSPLKLTLDLALYTNLGGTPTIESANNIPITANVSVDVTIANESVRVVDTSSSTGSTQIFEYDTGASIPVGSVNAYTFKLFDSDTSTSTSSSDTLYVRYTDSNKLRVVDGMSPEAQTAYTSVYRDTARFLQSSLGATGMPLTAAQLRHMVKADGLQNTGNQNLEQLTKLAEYLGVDTTSGNNNTIAQLLLDYADGLEKTGTFNKVNEGYNEYFTIDDGFDSESFTVRPVKKTTFDYQSIVGFDKSNITSDANFALVKQYAKENKHLETERTSKGYNFYFPLNVIIYDTYNGTSFYNGTWQLLTIKLRINNSAPVANTSLYTADKYFGISVTLEDNYRLNVADAVSDRDFLMIDGRFANKLELEDRKIADTSDYLEINNDGSETYYYADVANATAPTSDVIGYANYRANPAGDSTGTYVRGNIIPESERVIDVSVDFETNSSGSKYIKSVTFKALKKVTGRIWVVLRFRDNNGAFADFNVLVQVANKAPELLHTRDNGELSGVKQTTLVYGRDGMNAAAPEIIMKTGDYFDITVTPYDMYMNALSVEDRNKFNPNSRNEQAFGHDVDFNKIETENNKFIRNSTTAAYEGQNTYLGAYVVAEDDSPETLRLNSISTSGLNNKLAVMAQNVYTRDGLARTLSYRVEARGVANRLPLTVTVSDGDYTVSVIFTITVESTPPKVSTDPADDAALAEKGIEHVRPSVNPDSQAEANGVSVTDLMQNVLFNVRLKMSDRPFTVNLKDLCKDPDAGDADKMYLYEAFSGSCFSVGGNTSGVTESAYVSLDTILGSDGRAHSFTITPVNFMSGGETGSEKSFEQIVFYVMDANGQSLDYAQKIIINVYVEPNELIGTSENSENPNTKNFYDFTVKSKAEYNVADIADKQSRLTVVTPTAATRAVATGLVIDPDYGASKTAYSMSVFAMLRKKTDEAGNVTWESLANSVREFENLNVTAQGEAYTPFELKRYVYNSTDKVMVTESAYDANVNVELYRYVAQYFEFDISADGATINFTPVDTTKRTPIPLFVKIQKRDVPDDAKYKSEAYLAISVGNSAPTATVEGLTNADFYDGFDGDGFLTFSGYIGDSRTYSLHDKSEQTHGLFADLDTNDNVVINQAQGGENRGWEILPSYDYGDGVVNTSTGYLRDNTKGLGPALEVTTSSGSITIKFMRKIDAGDTESAEFVRLPMRVYGVDSMGETVSTVIILKVYNSAPYVRDWEEEGEVPPTAVGYTLARSTGDTFLLEATVERGKPLNINIADVYRDVDTYGLGADNPTNASNSCDSVNFIGDASRGYLSDISGKPTAIHSVSALGGTDELFRLSSPNANNSVLRVLCTSYSRGSVGEATLRIADGSGAAAVDIVIRLTVANSAPTVREGISTEIDMFGSEGTTDEFGVTVVEASYFNILSYITDNNVKDLTKYYEGLELTENPTFLRISSITLGDTTTNGGAILIEPALTEGATVGNINVFNAGVSETNPQEFYIRPLPGVYGWQNVTLRVQDDGNNIFSEDALSCDITLRIRIAYGSDTMITNVIDIDRGRSELVTIGDILDRYETDSVTGAIDFKEYSNGYKLTGIDVGAESHRVELITQPMDNGTVSYRLKVKPVAVEGSEISVTAKCRVGSVERDVPFKILVGANANPVLKSEFAPEKVYNFSSSDESRDDGCIHLPASFFFTDDSEIDVMKFQSASSAISSIAEARVNERDGVNEIVIKFKANREVTITMSVVDETMEAVTAEIRVMCPDKPELGFFASAIIYIRSNPLMFAIILGALLLLIILLLIIILAVRKKRKMRKEIEALLVSEMEMEEQMLKLSAGQQTTAYNNSFGYLPPVQPPVSNAPLLGQGGPTQGAAPQNNAIGLNPGGSDSGNPPKNNDGFDGEGF